MSANLCFADLVLVLEIECFHQQVQPWFHWSGSSDSHWATLGSSYLDSKDKKGITVLAGMIDPDHQGEIRLLLHKRGKGKYIWNIGDPLGCLLVLPYPVIRSMEN